MLRLEKTGQVAAIYVAQLEVAPTFMVTPIITGGLGLVAPMVAINMNQ